MKKRPISNAKVGSPPQKINIVKCLVNSAMLCSDQQKQRTSGLAKYWKVIRTGSKY